MNEKYLTGLEIPRPNFNKDNRALSELWLQKIGKPLEIKPEQPTSPRKQEREMNK